ncbi:MAG: T9SS type A sorting domain-containing protein [Bacteroidetes bacterium]|nr:T9SS type A sorting domain-containing protein [Bacteroidota bacterium]
MCLTKIGIGQTWTQLGLGAGGQCRSAYAEYFAATAHYEVYLGSDVAGVWKADNIAAAGIHDVNNYQYNYISNHEIMRHTNKFLNPSYTSTNNVNYLFVCNISGIHRITMDNTNPNIQQILSLENSWVSDIFFGEKNVDDRLVYFTTGNTRVFDDQGGNFKDNTIHDIYWGNLNDTEDDIAITGSLELGGFLIGDEEHAYCLQVLEGAATYINTDDRILVGSQYGLHDFKPTTGANGPILGPSGISPYQVTSILPITGTTTALVTIYNSGVFVYDYTNPIGVWGANLIIKVDYHRKNSYAATPLTSTNFIAPLFTQLRQIHDANGGITGYLLFNERDDFEQNSNVYNYGILYSPAGANKLPTGNWESVNTDNNQGAGANEHDWGWNKSSRPCSNINSNFIVDDVNNNSTLLVGKQGNIFVSKADVTGSDTHFQQIYTHTNAANTNQCNNTATSYQHLGYVNTAAQSIFPDNNSLLWISERDRLFSYSKDNGDNFNQVTQAATCVNIDPSMAVPTNCANPSNWDLLDCFVIAQNPFSNNNDVYATVNEDNTNSERSRVLIATNITPNNPIQFNADNTVGLCTGTIEKILFTSATTYIILVDEATVRRLRYYDGADWVDFVIAGGGLQNITDAILSPDATRLFIIRSGGANSEIVMANILPNNPNLTPIGPSISSTDLFYKNLVVYPYNNGTNYRVIASAEHGSSNNADCLFHVYNSNATTLSAISIGNTCAGSNPTPSNIFSSLIDVAHADNQDGGVTSLDVNTNLHTLYVATGGLIGTQYRTHLYKGNYDEATGDIDACWAEITGNLPNKAIQCFSTSQATINNEQLYACVRGLGEWRNTISTVIGSSTVNSNAGCIGGSAGNVTITPLQGEAPYSIIWSTSAISWNINNLSAGTYTYTITDATGFSFHGEVEITADQNCCGTGTNDITSQNDFDSYSGNFVSTSFNLNTDIILSNNATFDAATFYIAQGRSITIPSGIILTITNSTTLSACGNMWQGIIVEDGGTLNIEDGSSIQDAQYGARVINNGNVTCNSAVFDRNYVGLRFEDTQTGTILISGTTFSCNNCATTTPLASLYTGQTPVPLEVSFAGVQAENSVFNVGIANEDHNHIIEMNCGISLDNCVTRVLESDFTNIKSHTLAPYGPSDGIGVYADLMIGGVLNQTGLGIDAASPPTFNDCTIGINALGGSVSVLQNIMESMETGVIVENVISQNIFVYDNDISATSIGIDLRNNDLAKYVRVFHNNVTMNGANAIGISVNETNAPAIKRSFGIHCNNIDMQEGILGMQFNACSKLAASYNQIQLNSATTSITGIDVTSGMSCSFLENTVNGNTINRHTALKLSLSPSCYVTNNHVDNTDRGIEFSGACPTFFRGNTMYSHNVGLRLDNTAIIGLQGHNGNKWLRYTGGANPLWVGAVNENTQLGNNGWNGSIFNVHVTSPATIYHPNQLVGTNPMNGVGWFSWQGGTPFIGTFINECQDIQAKMAGDDDPNPFDYDVVNGNINAVIFDPEVEYMAERMELIKVNDNAAMLNDGGVFENFADSINSTSAGQLNQVYDNFQSTTAAEILLAYLDSVITVKSDSLQYFDSLVVQNPTIANKQARENCLVMIVQYKDQIEIANSNLQTELDAMANNSMQINASVIAANDIEAVEKKVNEYLLNYNSQNSTSIPSADVEVIQAISLLCPLAFGPSVYKARSIMHSFGMAQANYNDAANCLQLGYYRQSKNNTINSLPTLFINPNPAYNQIVVELPYAYDVASSIQLYNETGMLVFSDEIAKRNKFIAITIEALSAGVYTIKLINSLCMATSKFVKLK